MRRMSSKTEGEVPPFTFEQLHSFAGLVRWGKQAAVTAALGKSQPQISRDLAALEKGLSKTVLFNRAARQPTAAGEKILSYAATVLDGWHQLQAQLQEESGWSGKVVLAVDPDVCSILLPALAALKRRLPALLIQTKVSDPLAASHALRSGSADVGILRTTNIPTGLHVRPLLEAKVMVAVSENSPLAKRKQVSLAMLAGQTVLVPGQASGFRELLAAKLHGSKASRFGVAEIGPGREALLSAVAAELGVALIPFFGQAGDSVLLQTPTGIVIKATKDFGAVNYSIAVRRGLKPGGPAGALIKSLLREFRAD